MMSVYANSPKNKFRYDAIGLDLNRLKSMVFVKKLEEWERGLMLRHFLALNDGDRLLRFGTVLPDSQMAVYVQRIDFLRDTVYGVYGDGFSLVAVGHLAFPPKEVVLILAEATDKESVAEFGVSVDRSVRGMGLGKKMIQRAITHCRNVGVDTLYSHCLSSNQALMHIVKKSGFEIRRDYSEADAYLDLLPPDTNTIVQEALEEQFAKIDYTFKASASAYSNWFDRAFQFSLIVVGLVHMHGLIIITISLLSQRNLFPITQHTIITTDSRQY
jgi:RimJ/RimL family protein N-acetyltransferase